MSRVLALSGVCLCEGHLNVHGINRPCLLALLLPCTWGRILRAGQQAGVAHASGSSPPHLRVLPCFCFRPSKPPLGNQPLPPSRATPLPSYSTLVRQSQRSFSSPSRAPAPSACWTSGPFHSGHFSRPIHHCTCTSNFVTLCLPSLTPGRWWRLSRF